jgi:hypothetical protein
MVAEIETATGVRVPLGTLVEAPTIERLAEVVRAGGKLQRGRALVPIQPLGGRPPLFCVHGHVGEVLFYRDLSRRLGAEQPFYGLQSHGLVGGPAHSSVEAMAAEYLREVRFIQPRGPYFIGGFCLGAVVAFEMAQQLLSEGEQVALLALFWGTAHKSPIASRIRLHLGGVRDTGWRYLVDRVRDRMRSRFGTGVPAINLQAARRYAPRPYPGRMTVFVSGGDRDLAGMSADETEVIEVPGDRDTMLREPFVGALAERLDAILGGKR